MNFLETLVGTPLAQAVGWTLLHSLWQGALVAAALAAALATTRSPRARYAAAGAAMLVLLGAVGFTFGHFLPEGVHGLQGAATSEPPAWIVRTDYESTGSSIRLAAIVPWLAPFWMLGVWFFALGQFASWVSVSRLRWRGVCGVPEKWRTELGRLGAELRLSRPVEVLESCLAEVPMVVGHLRPVILMPVGVLAGLPAGQVEAILLHELAHIRRHDYLINVFQRTAECLLFYHPAVWWVSHVMRVERENCCDDVVVETRGNAHEYATALAALERNRSLAGEAALAATGGSLVRRVRRLLYPKSAGGAWTPTVVGAVLVVAAATTLAAWPRRPTEDRPPAAPALASRQKDTAYDRWLNQEVVYIITDRERDAFERLSTDDERQKFVEQFWERRNPSPGSKENKFKEEYYRRIAYADAHFGAGSRPGWKTDRGYTYITYGPPDEINVTGYGPAPASHIPYGMQVWTYRHVKALNDILSVTFFDRKGRGDFEFAPVSGQLAHTGEATAPSAAPSAALAQKGSVVSPSMTVRKEPSSTRFQRWLNEEVVYIITAQEREQSENLESDEKRDQFIYQFWERRNPNTGSPENIFKQEYYRRIAYANEHFATDRPGWKSDRGHLYILFGPPDEIDSNPSGTPYPTEVWTYRHVKGFDSASVFKFADTKNTGEYQLVSPPWKSTGETNSAAH